ncbi:HPP family protein [Shewanella marisflavi]|uniref:CBS domain-containing protein n=1 Tax=Shewanella TaxID=22 RepID=UPI00200EEE97|nr:CBS domain-containing protein [Shewanella marisflavi]MCL1040343.1 CBS domain-containing protein [Shewanella marisflavi]
MRVSDIMTTEIVCISDQATIKDAHLLMSSRGVRHLPVVSENDGALVGILTHKKMIATVMSILTHYGNEGLDRQERRTLVADIMEREFQKVTLDEPLLVIVDYFIDNKLGCLPVVDDSHKVIGILTSSDFVKLCATLLKQ